MTAKPGRNEPCPCGSGKKFKHCHGGPNAGYEEIISRGAEEAERQATIHRLQRERQQGLGRGILSVDASGTRLVIVGRRKCWGKWKTFHDFLYAYVIDVLGRDWFKAENDKAPADRHSVLVWHERLLGLSRSQQLPPDQAKFIPITGAVNAYLTLAHDLYTVEHNADQAHTPGI